MVQIKTIGLKIVLSVIVLAAVALFFHLTDFGHIAQKSGEVRVVIVDNTGETVFDDNLIIKEGDSFFDVLDRQFDIICANALYQPDQTCLTVFSALGDARVVLGISGEGFSVITDWNNTFLAFELFDGTSYQLASYGPSHLKFEDRDKVRITVRGVTGE